MVAPILAAGMAGGAVVGGALLARDVQRYRTSQAPISQGGTPHGTLTGQVMGFRHLIGFGLRNLHRPQALWAMFTGERDARRGEHELFRSGGQNGYDNGPDAYRHAYGSALMVHRMVTDAGLAPREAVALAREAGLAHEEDSHLVGPHYHHSRAMDEHNNELGFRVATRLLREDGFRDPPGAEQRLSAAILDAIRAGRAVVLDHIDAPPRPSVAADVDQPAPIPHAPGWTEARAHRRVA